VRLPAALFGAGAVVMLCVLISQICSWPIAIGFGVIFTFLPFNLYYSQEARPYAIVIFLLLCTIWALNRFFNSDVRNKPFSVLTLLFFSTTFLYSRSLSPLVVTVSLLVILCFWLILVLLKADPQDVPKKHLIISSALTLLVALVFCFPFYKIILAKSARYVPDTSVGINLAKFITVITNFDLLPIWKAYVVQTEPLTYPLLILVGLSPLLGSYMGLHRKNTIWALTFWLLPIACISNLFIFQAKSNMPFRPAYASYILPLAFILAAVSTQGLWMLAGTIRYSKIAKVFILILATVFTFQSVMAAIDYKRMQRKPDWRGIAAFLAKNYNSQHLLIFDSFTHYITWEPTFYGFPRYYRGRSPLESMGRIHYHAHKMIELSHQPIVVLFQWREYYLTSRSAYPILSVPSPDQKTIDYNKFCLDPGLICTDFTGFSLIQLQTKSNNLARDTYDLLAKILALSPEGSWNVERQLAAAALARALNLNQWQSHLLQAEGIVHGSQLQKVKDIAVQIRNIETKKQ
jgi:hypothetical protein